MLRLIFLFLIAFLVGADEFLLGPILTPIGADLSVPSERIALFITAYSLPLAVMAPILGGVSDRYGRLAALIPSTLVFGIASIATSFVPTFESGIATRIMYLAMQPDQRNARAVRCCAEELRSSFEN